MVRFMLIGILTVVVVCAIAITIWLCAERLAGTSDAPQERRRRRYTCYISDDYCINEDVPCQDCRIFRERMDPSDDPDIRALQAELEQDLRREVSAVTKEPPLQTQEAKVRTQDPEPEAQEPPMSPEFVELGEWLQMREKAKMPWVEEKQEQPPGKKERRGREIIQCAFKGKPCVLPEGSGDPCTACFYMRDGEILPKAEKDEAE